MVGLSSSFQLRGQNPYAGPKPPTLNSIHFFCSVCSWAPGLGFSPFARRYLGNRCFFLFLGVLRCFSSPGSPHTAIYSLYDTWSLHQVSFLIRISAGRGLFAALRSFSQLVTSFFGSWCQGIRHMLFVAWSFFKINLILAVLCQISLSFTYVYLYDWLIQVLSSLHCSIPLNLLSLLIISSANFGTV